MQERPHEWEGGWKDWGRTRRGGEPLCVWGGVLPLEVSNVGCPPDGGVYYIVRGGGVGGFMVWVMAVHKTLMPDV